MLATANQHKLIELTRILAAGQVDVALASLAEFPGAPDVAETGATFAENALLKARAIAEFTGLPAVADDSGLCVDALNGMPGVLSARWSGTARRRRGEPAAAARPARRRARTSGAVRSSPARPRWCCRAGREHVSEGVVRGRLIREPRGRTASATIRSSCRSRVDHNGRDGPGGQGRDQPPRQGLARPGPGDRRAAWLISKRTSVEKGTSMAEVRLAPGDAAPDFTLPDADGNEVSLSSLRGERVIIYFYPAAMTPGCTKQACDFRDSLASLAAAGFAVLGISPDSPAKLAKFRDRDGLNFPLLSDQKRTVLEAYGAYGEKMLYGKKSVGVIRSTFVVGADGKIEQAQYAVKATGHVARLRKELGV